MNLQLRHDLFKKVFSNDIHVCRQICDQLWILLWYSLLDEVKTIVELGTHIGCSTRIFLMSDPEKLISIDIEKQPIIETIEKEYDNFQFILSDTLKIDPVPKCDLLLIDSDHSYKHVITELYKYEPNVSRYILMHDINLPAVDKAMNEFLENKKNKWKLDLRFNGRYHSLGVLKRL